MEEIRSEVQVNWVYGDGRVLVRRTIQPDDVVNIDIDLRHPLARRVLNLSADQQEFITKLLTEIEQGAGRLALLFVKPEDILVMHVGHQTASEIEAAVDNLSGMDPGRTVVVLRPGESLAAMDPEEIRNLGWVRAEEVATERATTPIDEQPRIAPWAGLDLATASPPEISDVRAAVEFAMRYQDMLSTDEVERLRAITPTDEADLAEVQRQLGVTLLGMGDVIEVKPDPEPEKPQAHEITKVSAREYTCTCGAALSRQEGQTAKQWSEALKAFRQAHT